MHYHSFSLSIAVLAISALAGCADKSSTVTPQPACYSGVVLEDRCMDGVLIQVDPQSPIGRPAQLTDTAGTNVIANVETMGTLGKRGQRVYFTYTNDPSRQAPLRPCPAYGVPLPVPHLVLNNVSATPCTQF